MTPVATAQLVEGSDEVSNPNIRISEATRNGALLYDDFGTLLHIWQIDFTNLNIPVRGGTKTRFGVWGMAVRSPARTATRTCGLTTAPMPRSAAPGRMAPTA